MGTLNVARADIICIDILNVDYFLLSVSRIILSGDIETNPGPTTNTNRLSNASLSIAHLNIRSIRNKLEYIKDNYLDFDVLCFTETHLTDIIDNNMIILEEFNTIYRKDNSAHSGGLLVYVSATFPSRRLTDLEAILPESIWVEIKDKSNKYFICNVYRPPNYSVEFWHKLNVCIESASELTNQIVIVGDINEDQLNPTNTKLRNILMINNMRNIITEPTRITEHSQTLIDPISVTENIFIYDSGVINSPAEISDHRGTYVYLHCNLTAEIPFKRKVWNYKRADFTLLNHLITTTDWSFINDNCVSTACEAFSNKLLELLHVCIPSSMVTIRPNDKPWYNSLIRKTSRQRDRQKHTAQNSNISNDWKNISNYVIR